MRLQGDLQSMFDALFFMGVIDPLLKLDWNKELKEFTDKSLDVQLAMAEVNSCDRGSHQMILKLQRFDRKTLEFLAMEVAREYATFHSRDNDSLH